MLDILAIGAHPDDIECGIGGTLLLAKQHSLSIGMIVLTEGEAGKSNNDADRQQEQYSAATLLGADHLKIFNFGDSKLENSLHKATLIAEQISELQPRIILYIHGDDFHPDHQIAAELVERAVFLARFDGQLFSYSLNFKQYIKPDIVIDITTVVERKRQLLQAHASQYELLRVQELLNCSTGVLARCHSAEGLICKYPLRLNNLSQLF